MQLQVVKLQSRPCTRFSSLRSILAMLSDSLCLSTEAFALGNLVVGISVLRMLLVRGMTTRGSTSEVCAQSCTRNKLLFNDATNSSYDFSMMLLRK